jgi:hypothetical protein
VPLYCMLLVLRAFWFRFLKCDMIFLFNMQLFSVKMMDGIVATSYSLGDKFYIDPAKLLPLSRFLSQPKYVFSLPIF